MNQAKIFVVSVSVIFLMVATDIEAACISYSVSDHVTEDDDIEYRFYCDTFHFGTVVVDSVGANVTFRAHPDKIDVNGWGTSWLMAPFLPGDTPTAGAVSVNSISAGNSGIKTSLSGLVADGKGGSYGSWAVTGMFAYDNVAQKVTAAGNLNINLNGTLAAVDRDLNLERIASNYLKDVPLQSGGVSDTGDMKEVVVTYGAQDPRDFVWHPVEGDHFPTDKSLALGIEVTGQINNVDTLALGENFQIAVAHKPTVYLSYVAADISLTAGLAWNSSLGQDFKEDNIGINHLVLRGNSEATAMTFGFSMESYVEQPQPNIIADLSGGSLSVRIQLNGGHGEQADWWLAAVTPWGDWYYYVYPDQWINAGPSLNDISVAYQGVLFNIDSYEILNISGLSPGAYWFYFGVDMDRNGLLDFDQLNYDSTEVQMP